MASKSGADQLFNKVLGAENTKVDFDLDNWITDFENGFMNYVPVNPLYKNGYWGQGIGNRPRIREMNIEADAQVSEGYRVIEFFPNRDVKDESYIFFGTPFELRIQIALFMNQYIMFKNMDIGAWVGYPIDEYLRTEPRTGITLQIFLTTYKSPPYYQRGTEWFSKRQVTIPDVDKSKVSFATIRTACGGETGLTWGEWSARAYLKGATNSKAIHQMIAGGSTEDIAKANLKKFLAFTNCSVARITANKIDYSEGEDKNDPNKTKYNSFTVYPAWITVMNSKLFPRNDLSKTGKSVIKGKQVNKQLKLNTYIKAEPAGWQTNFNSIVSHIWPAPKLPLPGKVSKI